MSFVTCNSLPQLRLFLKFRRDTISACELFIFKKLRNWVSLSLSRKTPYFIFDKSLMLGRTNGFSWGSDKIEGEEDEEAKVDVSGHNFGTGSRIQLLYIL
jgi:hypothetical protein